MGLGGFGDLGFWGVGFWAFDVGLGFWVWVSVVWVQGSVVCRVKGLRRFCCNVCV